MSKWITENRDLTGWREWLFIDTTSKEYLKLICLLIKQLIALKQSLCRVKSCVFYYSFSKYLHVLVIFPFQLTSLDFIDSIINNFSVLLYYVKLINIYKRLRCYVDFIGDICRKRIDFYTMDLIYTSRIQMVNYIK